MQGYRLCIARPVGWNLEGACIGTWMFHFGFTLGRISPEVREVLQFEVVNHRVPLSRNLAVQYARKNGCTHLLMLDPDMAIDRYVKWDKDGRPGKGSKAFWSEVWPFAKTHPGSIIAAPYCGRPEQQEPVHVFVKMPTGELTRVRRETAMGLSGWTSVEAVGAGTLLIDCSIFDKLNDPIFYDTYTDKTQTVLRHSSDVEFSLRCRALGVPIYVNWDCWAGHWQLTCIEKPGFRHPPAKDILEPLSPDPTVPVLLERGNHGGAL